MCQGWRTNTSDTASFLICSGKKKRKKKEKTLGRGEWTGGGGGAETVHLEQTGPMLQFTCGVFGFCPLCFLPSAHELLRQINGEEQKEPRWVDKEENRWNANDKPPSALEDDQNLDTLQQSHNPLLQKLSRHPIHALSYRLPESV